MAKIQVKNVEIILGRPNLYRHVLVKIALLRVDAWALSDNRKRAFH